MDDSVWHVYERNCSYYHECKNLNECPNLINNYCRCSNDQTVFPPMIGDCGFVCERINLKKKCYIAFGETCPICIEPIIYKNTSWITPCGHTFHRKCLLNAWQYYDFNDNIIKYGNTMPCPICREDLVYCCIGAGLRRYNVNNMFNKEKENELDKLENFWLTRDDTLFLKCRKCKKPYGFDSDCINCL